MSKKQAIKAIIFFGVMIMILAYYISGIFTFVDLSFENFQSYLLEVITHPFKIWWNKKTSTCLGLGVVVWLMVSSYLISQTGNFMFGKEHGDVKWANIKKVNERFADKTEAQNRILSERVRVTFDTNKSDMNNNTLYIGGSGKGKGFRNIIPNLVNGYLRAHVVTDAKGDTLRLIGKLLEDSGQEVRVLNLIDFEKSLHYNPFFYIKHEEDISRLVDNIMENTKINTQSAPTDQFWEDGPRMLIIAIFNYIWMEYPRHKQNWTSFFELLDMVSPEEEKNMFAKKIKRLETAHPMGRNHPAVKNYKIFAIGAQETMSSILMVTVARLRVFRLENVQWLMKTDELGLYDIGTGVLGNPDKKVSLFILIPDEHILYSPIVGMIYTQLFQILFEQARERGGKLPFDVGFELDEYANIKMPGDFIREVATVRSRRIYTNIYIQNIGQVKSIHKDDWTTIFENCDTLVYLGSGTGGKETFEYISELLGDFTLHKRSSGITYGQNRSNNSNVDVMARKLMMPHDIRKLSSKECIILLPGVDPIKDKKYVTQEKGWFKKVKELGEYQGNTRVIRSGIKSLVWTDVERVNIEFLNTEEMKNFHKQAKSGSNIIEVDEETLMSIDFSNPSFEPDKLKDLMLRNKTAINNRKKQDEEALDLSFGSAYDWLNKYPLDGEQREEIILALEDGMTDEEIKTFYNPEYTARQMNQMRRLLMISKTKEEEING